MALGSVDFERPLFFGKGGGEGGDGGGRKIISQNNHTPQVQFQSPLS